MKISNKARRFLELAARTAVQSTCQRQKHGAVLVKGGQVINVANNNTEYSRFARRFCTSNWGKRNYPTRHAELSCVLGLDKKITFGATMFVVRISNSGILQNSKPCPMCRAALEFCGVKKIIYTTGKNSIKMERI